MFEFLKDLNNYESRKVARDEVNGLEVSTAYTSDYGYETAILDQNGAHPVERYLDKSAAIVGHAIWLEYAKTATGVIELGAWGIIPDKEITLIRKT